LETCKFCEIVRGRREASIVFENAEVVAFLDSRPLFPGHTLLVPRLHYETLPDLPESLIEPLFSAARLLARAVREAMGAQGTFVAMNNTVSQSVPHLHLHVVPRTKGDGLRGFFWPRQSYGDVAQEVEVARAIAQTARAAGSFASGMPSFEVTEPRGAIEQNARDRDARKT
jgi:histidine triad (HIT) family protein